MVKKARGKIPRMALEPLMQTCEWMSRQGGKSAEDIFKSYLGLMNRYADYFFSEPWPKKYDHERAMSFTNEDLEFLFAVEGEFWQRFETMCLKKNMYLDGFVGYFGMYWTKQAFYEKFVRPELKPILEAFEKHAEEDRDARSVLKKLKEQFNHLALVHVSLVDLLEHEYLDKARGLLVGEMLELMHKEEGLPPCGEYRCELSRKELHKDQSMNAST